MASPISRASAGAYILPHGRREGNGKEQLTQKQHSDIGDHSLSGGLPMLRILAIVMILLPVAGVCGCSWQANNASQAVNFDPTLIGSGQQVFSPANSFGYGNGESMDMRNRR
jgi:hypothetical protein